MKPAPGTGDRGRQPSGPLQATAGGHPGTLSCLLAAEMGLTGSSTSEIVPMRPTHFSEWYFLLFLRHRLPVRVTRHGHSGDSQFRRTIWPLLISYEFFFILKLSVTSTSEIGHAEKLLQPIRATRTRRELGRATPNRFKAQNQQAPAGANRWLTSACRSPQPSNGRPCPSRDTRTRMTKVLQRTKKTLFADLTENRYTFD